jgi:hypothetical protein
MKKFTMQRSKRNVGLALVAMLGLFFLPTAAQSPELQQRLAEVKQSAAENKQSLAHNSWQQQETISIKGDVKDVKLHQVHLGPTEQPEKVELENTPTSAGGRPHGLAHHVKEKKGEEYKEYGQQIAALAQQYVQPRQIATGFFTGKSDVGPSRRSR